MPVPVPSPVPVPFQQRPTGRRCGFWTLGSGYWHRPRCQSGIACPQSLTPGPCPSQGTIDHTFTPTRGNASQAPRQARLLVCSSRPQRPCWACGAWPAGPCCLSPLSQHAGSSCAAQPNAATPPVLPPAGAHLYLSGTRLARPPSTLPVAHIHFAVRAYLASAAILACRPSRLVAARRGPATSVKAHIRALPGLSWLRTGVIGGGPLHAHHGTTTTVGEGLTWLRTRGCLSY